MIVREKRVTVYLLILALTLTILSGCSPSNDGDKAGAAKPGKPVAGGNLVIGVSEEPASLNPFLPDGTSMATKLVTANILWGLLVVTPSLTHAPRIAETVPTLENGLVTQNPFTVTYRIKEEAAWSDGEPITSWDVQFTWQNIMDPKRNVADRAGYDKIETIQTPDAKTVKIIFKEPYMHYKELFSTTYPILPKHLLNGRSYDDLLSQMITFASGPYRFKKWTKGENITITRNENFWDKEPYIDQVIFKFASKSDSMFTGFRDGKLDMVYAPSDIKFIERLITLEAKEVRIEPGLVWEHVGFNLKNAHLGDENIRRAIAHALDRKKIAKEATGDEKVLQSVVMPQQDRYYVPSWKSYDYNLDKARDYLQKAGFVRGANGIYEKDGKPLKLEISTTAGNKVRERTVDIIKEDLTRAGIRVEVKNAAEETFFNTKLPGGDFEIGVWAWLAGDEPKLQHLFASDMTPPAGFNYYGYNDSFFTDVVKRLSRTVNQKERAAVYRIAQDKLSDDAVVIPLYQHPHVIAYDGRIYGIRDNVSFEGPFWNLNECWIAK
ncbi:MAG: peptide ABC transporter substrate-binding protein [Candidatus Aquicultor sp.]|nr:peptide ABC transporter substrate-binding protein [Candidatus Aquicultor sp.]